jgi:hypothetical protein
MGFEQRGRYDVRVTRANTMAETQQDDREGIDEVRAYKEWEKSARINGYEVKEDKSARSFIIDVLSTHQRTESARQHEGSLGED